MIAFGCISCTICNFISCTLGAGVGRAATIGEEKIRDLIDWWDCTCVLHVVKDAKKKVNSAFRKRFQSPLFKPLQPTARRRIEKALSSSMPSSLPTRGSKELTDKSLELKKYLIDCMDENLLRRLLKSLGVTDKEMNKKRSIKLLKVLLQKTGLPSWRVNNVVEPLEILNDLSLVERHENVEGREPLEYIAEAKERLELPPNAPDCLVWKTMICRLVSGLNTLAEFALYHYFGEEENV
jgi:hypothetical protein